MKKLFFLFAIYIFSGNCFAQFQVDIRTIPENITGQEMVSVFADIKNTESTEIEMLRCYLISPHRRISDSYEYLGTIKPGETRTADFAVLADNTSMPFSLVIYSSGDTYTYNFSLPINKNMKEAARILNLTEHLLNTSDDTIKKLISLKTNYTCPPADSHLKNANEYYSNSTKDYELASYYYLSEDYTNALTFAESAYESANRSKYCADLGLSELDKCISSEAYLLNHSLFQASVVIEFLGNPPDTRRSYEKLVEYLNENNFEAFERQLNELETELKPMATSELLEQISNTSKELTAFRNEFDVLKHNPGMDREQIKNIGESLLETNAELSSALVRLSEADLSELSLAIYDLKEAREDLQDAKIKFERAKTHAFIKVLAGGIVIVSVLIALTIILIAKYRRYKKKRHAWIETPGGIHFKKHYI